MQKSQARLLQVIRDTIHQVQSWAGGDDARRFSHVLALLWSAHDELECMRARPAGRLFMPSLENTGHGD
jgi:hypothetical protein